MNPKRTIVPFTAKMLLPFALVLFAACTAQAPTPILPTAIPTIASTGVPTAAPVPAPTGAPDTGTFIPPTPRPPTTVPPPMTEIPSPANAPHVSIQSGRVQGVYENNLSVFKGIPYAAAPVGSLRWRDPQPPPIWESELVADKFGNDCLQPPAKIGGAGSTGPQSEDCLYLNVWTPKADAAARLPVMVWIHGGALVIGAGSLEAYDGMPLATRGAVVVTLNYRLGHLGFFSHPALEQADPGGTVNFGLLDQIAALKWVQANIAVFGGDPGNVMIFGESAGGQSVLTLMASPLARGLFHKAVAESSYGIPGNTRAKALKAGINVATALGLDGANATLEQLRAVPAEKFAPLNAQDQTLAPVFVTGDAAVPEPILDVFQKGKEAAVPLIIGSNSDEATVVASFGIDPGKVIQQLGILKIALKPLYPGVTNNEQLGREVVRDLVFTSFAKRMADLHAVRAPSWRYYFSYIPVNLRGKEPGVPHGGEIVFVFDTWNIAPQTKDIYTAADGEVAKKVSAYWFEFARSGKPAPAGEPEWEQASSKSDRTMEFGDTIAMQSNLMRVRLNVFIDLLAILGRVLGRE